MKGVVKISQKKIFASRADCEKKLGGYFDVYLKEHPDEIADVESLAEYLGCTRRDIQTLEKDRRYGEAISRAKNSIARIKKQMAMKGKIPASVLSFDMKNNHDYSDKGDKATDEGTVIVVSGDARRWSE